MKIGKKTRRLKGKEKEKKKKDTKKQLTIAQAA